MSNRAYVHVNEIGSRIIPHAAAPQSQGRVSELQGRRPRKTNINRFGLNMQAVLGDARRMGTQILVAFGRPITANDVDFGVRTANGLFSIPQDIENPRIVVMHLSRAVVAQKMVQLRQRGGDIRIAMAIHDIQMFTGMGMVKPKVAVRNRGESFWNGNEGKHRKQS